MQSILLSLALSVTGSADLAPATSLDLNSFTAHEQVVGKGGRNVRINESTERAGKGGRNVRISSELTIERAGKGGRNIRINESTERVGKGGRNVRIGKGGRNVRI